MKEPPLTDDEKAHLALMAGCELEIRHDPVTGAVAAHFKYPLGFLWDGQQWIVSEARDAKAV